MQWLKELTKATDISSQDFQDSCLFPLQ